MRPRNIVLCAVLVLAIVTVCPRQQLWAADALPQVHLNADEIAPRPIEELTGKNITRDYAYAWQTLAQALDQNRAELLDGYFAGFAKSTLAHLVADQKKSGLRIHYLDHGHKVNAFFYSPNGDAMQLRDEAQLEIQVFDGSKMIRQEQVGLHYLVIMTPAADRWVVRMLEAVPSF
jgi:hypothetical protein